MQTGILDLSTCPLLTREDMCILLRLPTLMTRAVAHGWIKPVAKSGEGRNCREIYSRKDADKLVIRILSGEVPPPVIRK